MSPRKWSSSELPPVMLRPQLLPAGEAWTYSCPRILSDGAPCAVVTQGGLAGLRAHTLVVHDREDDLFRDYF